ncbi:MAG: family 43 glycosylhydrolase [Armatimonadota bacterium]|nr:family 43 glycosylhydrolase [Armatimonadota bacterium]
MLSHRILLLPALLVSLILASSAYSTTNEVTLDMKWEFINQLDKLSDRVWRSTGVDPFLQSEALGNLPTEGLQFEIKMKIKGPPSYGEVRWWGRGEGPDIARTLAFTPIADGEWRVYTISPFLQLKEWGTPMDRFRIDPTNQPDSEIEIEYVKLVPLDTAGVDYVATVHLDRKLHYPKQPIGFQIYYAKGWTGDLPRPMFTYSVSDGKGAKVRQGVTLGIPAYNRHYSIVMAAEPIESLPAGAYTLQVELRNDKAPSRPVRGSLAFEVIDPSKRRVLTLPWQYVKDYTVIHAGGLFHAFGLVGRADQNQDWGEEPLQNEKQFFHATSPDLVSWTQHPDILHCPASGYDDRGVWAPYVLKSGDRYWMFYTGTQKGVVQRFCAATSHDLFAWTRRPENPLFSADGTEWARSVEGSWTDYRDPMVFRDEPNKRWIACNVAMTKDAPSVGAVAAATSEDLVHWRDAGPILKTGPHIPESPFLWKMGEKYYLSVNAGGRGIYVGDSPLGPFTKLDPDPMPQNVMAYEVLQVTPDLWLLSGFAWEVNGNYIEFFELSLKDGKPFVRRDLTRALERVNSER